MMKRIALLALCLITVLSSTACGGKSPDKAPSSEPKAKLTTLATHGFDKTVVNVTPQGEHSNDYTVYLAKGETEGCQVSIHASEKVGNITLTLASGGDGNIGVSVFAMNKTHNIGKKLYTDSLIPYYGRKLMLDRRMAIPFMIEFTTTSETEAGEYKYVYEVKDSDGKVLATYNITVHVWDFELPKEKTFATGMAVARDIIGKTMGANTDEIYKQWYDFLLDHNICAYVLPYDLLDDSVDEYLNNPRVTSFVMPIPEKEDGTVDEEKLLQYYDKVKQSPKWLEKAYFFPVDEPKNTEEVEKLEKWCELLNELCPGIDVIVPYYTNVQMGDDIDQTAVMSEYIDLWCPKLCLWDVERSYGDYLDYTPEKSFAERMLEEQKKGDRVWSYVCNDPIDPYAQMFIDTAGVNQRLMFWQMYQRDIEGFIYWMVNYYGNKEGPEFEGEGTLQNPWETVNTKITDGDGNPIYGCGFILYPGLEVGYGGPIASIRAKIVRDGVDDIEMFYLAEKYLGKDWLVEKTKEGSPSLTEFVSGDEFCKLRIEIGNALEAAMKAQ